ncbi:MAG: ribbon-helix-helix protein, CopG family [Nitrospirae bacterium]|nr:ribbon-helix-helix protein, CopG family [Nitrospirota bacterium]MBI3351555.1 ribbon-helix-helix protein, CopG family [Nitrospirota bacterium]
MPTTKVAITLDEEILEEVDRLVKEKKYPNRSKAIQEAIQFRLERWHKTRMIEEAKKFDIEEEQTIAEEGLVAENETWPEY